MNERTVCIPVPEYQADTLGSNVTRYVEFPWPVAYQGAKAWASNDSSATLALSGATSLSIAAQAIGDSGDPAWLTPAATDVHYEPANSLITVTLDYDGESGTAAEDVGVFLFFLVGDD